MLAISISRRPALPTLVIRNIDDTLHATLKAQAAAQGRSMEEEVRCILRERLAVAPLGGASGWVDAIRAMVEPLGGIDLREPEREALRDPPDFSGPEWDLPV
jgi:plasmid stability protein